MDPVHIENTSESLSDSEYTCVSDLSMYSNMPPSEIIVSMREFLQQDRQLDDDDLLTASSMLQAASEYSIYSQPPSETNVTVHDEDSWADQDVSVYSLPPSQTNVTFADLVLTSQIESLSEGEEDLLDCSIYSEPFSEIACEMPFPVSSHPGAPLVSDSIECLQRLRNFILVPVQEDHFSTAMSGFSVSTLSDVSIYSVEPSEIDVEPRSMKI